MKDFKNDIGIKKMLNIKKLQKDFLDNNWFIFKLRFFSELGFRIFFYPLDRLRLIKQTKIINKIDNYKGAYENILKNQNFYKGLYRMNFLTFTLSSFRNLSNIFMINTSNIAFLKKGEHNYSNQQNYIRKTCALLFSNFIITFNMYPWERLALLSSIDVNSNRKIPQYFLDIIIKDGILSLYRGVTFSFLSKIPEFYLMYFLHDLISNKKDNIHNIHYEYFLSSCLLYPLKTLVKMNQVNTVVLNKNTINISNYIQTMNYSKFLSLYNGFSLYLLYTGSLIIFQKKIMEKFK